MAPGGGLPTERQTQRAILQMMGLCFPRVFVNHVPNGAHLAGSQVARFKQMGALKGDGLKAGFPDLIALWAGRGGAFIEVKRPKLGKQSEAQVAMQGTLEGLGWPYAVVTSPAEAYEFLKGLGAPWNGAVWNG
jgi:hypothetical protein